MISPALRIEVERVLLAAGLFSAWRVSKSKRARLVLMNCTRSVEFDQSDENMLDAVARFAELTAREPIVEREKRAEEAYDDARTSERSRRERNDREAD